MISIKQLNEKYIDLCHELDSNTISLWTKRQWSSEFKKEGIKVFGLLLENSLIGICVFHVVLDEAQINIFVVNHEFREKGYGSLLMDYVIKQCKKFKINKLLLEVSLSNITADKFYNRFDFYTVGIRRNYYKDGSNALLKEKKLTTI
jgi:ribosomal-protein-alanine N-acetyltransferase